MKRCFPFFILPLFLGLCGAFLRATELSYSFDPQSGLHVQHLSATPVLMVLSVVALLVFSALSFRIREEECSAAPSPAFLAAGALSAVVLLASAGLQIYQCVTAFAVTTLIQALLSVYTATALLALAKSGLSRSNGGVYAVFAVAPVFWLCFTLILVYRERIADPILLDYTYLLFACICSLLFFYALAGYVYGKNKLRLAALTGSLAVFFSAAELGGHLIATVFPLTSADLSLSTLELTTLLACLILIPFALHEILKNRNQVQ